MNQSSNGTTQNLSIDANGKVQVGQSMPIVSNGGTRDYNEYKAEQDKANRCGCVAAKK